jgi:putative endonuclease
MTLKKRETYRKGQLGEWIAVLFLRLKGYTILERRFKTPFGEIDIIAKRGRTIAAIEVKFRQTLQEAAESISDYQKQRIQNAFLMFLKKYPKPADVFRFDALLISPYKWPIHIKNAWFSII